MLRLSLVLLLLLSGPALCAETATLTMNVVLENSLGHDGGIQWQSAFLRTDGTIASFGTGNHNYNQTNSMRLIDITKGEPVMVWDWLWHQTGLTCDDSGDGCQAPEGGTACQYNTYMWNYDNHPSIYLPSDDKVVWFSHGVYDFATQTWTHGSCTPLTSDWDTFVYSPSFDGDYFNPGWGYSSTLDVAAFYGGMSGGGASQNTNLIIMSRYTDSGYSWRTDVYNMAGEGMSAIHHNRNEAVAIGSNFYIHGPGPASTTNLFYKVDLETQTLLKTLTASPLDGQGTVYEDYFPAIVYDSARNILVRIGQKVRYFDLANEDTATWVDITPSNWPAHGFAGNDGAGINYGGVRAVYAPDSDAIYFNGTPYGAADGAGTDKFYWHKLEFGIDSSTDIPLNTWIRKDAPAYPTSPGSHNKHTKWTYNSSDHKLYGYGGDYSPGAAGQNSQEAIYSYDVATNTWASILNRDDACSAGLPLGRCNPIWQYDASRNKIWMTNGQSRQHDGGDTRQACNYTGGVNPRDDLRDGGAWTFTVSGATWADGGVALPGVPETNWGGPSPYSGGDYSTATGIIVEGSGNGGIWYGIYHPGTDKIYAPYTNGSGYILAAFDPGTGDWSDLGDLPESFPYAGMQAGCLDTKRDRLVFYFAWPGEPVPNNTGRTYAYDPNTTTWTKLSETVLPAKSQYGLAYDSNADRIVLFGGGDSHEGGTVTMLNQTYILNPNTNNWSELTVANDGTTEGNYGVGDRKGETLTYDPYHNVLMVVGGTGWESTGVRDEHGNLGSEVFVMRLADSPAGAASTISFGSGPLSIQRGGGSLTLTISQ